METFKKYWYIWVAIIIVLIIIFRKEIMDFFGMNKPATPPAEGSACNIPGGVPMPGTIVNGVCVPKLSQPSIIGKKLKVLDTNGVLAADLDANGCAQLKTPQALIPAGTESEILEVKKIAIEQCSNSEAMTFVRTTDGWFAIGTQAVQVI